MYAKWIPIDTPSPSPSSPTAPTTPQPKAIDQKVKVDDTGISSGFYIICISTLLTTFGVLIVIKALNDKNEQQNNQ